MLAMNAAGLLQRAVLARPVRAQATRCGGRRLRVYAKATEPEAVVDANVNAYCTLDKDGKRPVKELSLGEKEALFLEAMSAYYYEGKPAISDQEFDNLKEELVWEGSKVAVLTGDEQRFLEAQQAFNAGKPIMSDADYDALRQRLKQSGSVVTMQGPRCSLRSGAMYSDAEVDYLKMVGLNIPPALLVLGGLFSVDDLTGFEITRLVELPEPYGIIVVWGFVLPVVYILANAIANALFKDALILKAPCPNCGTTATTYFGDILTVPGNRDRNTVECAGCKAKLTFDSRSREVEVAEMPKDKAAASGGAGGPGGPGAAKKQPAAAP